LVAMTAIMTVVGHSDDAIVMRLFKLYCCNGVVISDHDAEMN
jgi:hypothetical protein